MDDNKKCKSSLIILNYEKSLTKEEVKYLLRSKAIPDHQIEKLLSYTMGNPHMIRYFIDNYDKRDDNFSKLKQWAIGIYEDEFKFESAAQMKLLAACSLISRISYSLFANLAYHFKLSSYQLNDFIKKNKVFYEKNGYYMFCPIFHDFLAKKIEQCFSAYSKDKIRTMLITYLVKESNFLVEYLKLAETKTEKAAMENRLIETIITNGLEYYDNDLFMLSSDEVQNPGLKLLFLISKNLPFNQMSIKYLLTDLENTPLYKVILEQYYFYLGKNLHINEDIPGLKCVESDYFHIVENWINGQKQSRHLNEIFYLKYGFFSVPDYIIHEFDESVLLKGTANSKGAFLGRVTVLYRYYLKGEYIKAQKLFYHLLKTSKKYLIKDYKELYFFILSHHFYARKRNEKAKWYLEAALKQLENKGDKIFVLKILNTYVRILFEEKDLNGLNKLLEKSKIMLTREKPFLVFLQYLKGSIKILKGEKISSDFDDSIQYSIEIGDEVAAVQYYSYTLNQGELAKNNLLKVQEGLLDCNKSAIYQNTSIIDLYKKINMDINFFGPFKLLIDNNDLSQELMVRKKLRKLLNYLVFHHPNKVSREEIKRVFWDKEKSFDIDANLRVAISNLKKIFKAHGYDDLFVCQNGKVFLNNRYIINNDFKKYSALYKKAKLYYKNTDFNNAEAYLKKIINLNVVNVFVDISWDYLENKVRNQVVIIISNSLEMLIDLAKRKKDFDKAEYYCRKLAAIDPKYIKELTTILQKNGRDEEAQTIIKKSNNSSKSLETIFFPE